MFSKHFKKLYGENSGNFPGMVSNMLIGPSHLLVRFNITSLFNCWQSYKNCYRVISSHYCRYSLHPLINTILEHQQVPHPLLCLQILSWRWFHLQSSNYKPKNLSCILITPQEPTCCFKILP